MKKYTSVCALTLIVGACGGGSNPFIDNAVAPEPPATTDPAPVPTTDPVVVTEAGIPVDIANDLESLSFNAENGTLVVTGLTQDGTSFNNSYDFVSEGQQNITTSDGSDYAAFVDGYTTFTRQNDALGRHSTAFVASREGVQAGVVMTGGQFNTFFSGVFYERDGVYTAPTAPDSRFDVTYHGSYAAGLNIAGPNTNLTPITGPIDPDVDVPVQTGYIRGLIFVNVDLNDLSVEGEIFDREAVFQSGDPNAADDIPSFATLPDIVLVEGVLAEDGSFTGGLEVDGDVGNSVGEFAGLIGGPSGETLAGGTNLDDFDDSFTNEIEFGVFVLDICEAGDTDPICVNSQP